MIQNPIATRSLYVVDNKSETYVAEIYAPVQAADGCFECELKITNAPEGLEQMKMVGVDSYHADLLG